MRHRLDIPHVGRLAVTRTSVVQDLRRVYRYEIWDAGGELLTRASDLRSGCSADFGAHPGPGEMTGSLLSFLTCAPESFNARTAHWARQHQDELTIAALELEADEEAW